MPGNLAARNIIHTIVLILNLFLIFITYRYITDINTLGDKTLSVLYFIIFVSVVSFLAGALANKKLGSIGIGQIRNISKHIEFYIPILAVLFSVIKAVTHQ